MKTKKKTKLKSSFIFFGWCDGISLLVLLGIAMPLKYLYDQPESVRIVGSLHGFFFVSYVLLAVLMTMRQRWSFLKLALCVFLSSVPFGVWYFEKKYLS